MVFTISLRLLSFRQNSRNCCLKHNTMASSFPTSAFRTAALCALFLLLWKPGSVTAGAAWESKLRKSLFHNFDPRVRPVKNSSDNVTIIVDISLNHLVDLNEKMQVLQTETWVRLAWKDPQLTWDPAEHGNVTKIYVNNNDVWTPDIIIYNEVGLEPGRPPTEFLVSIKFDGSIQWPYPRTVETSCKMDVEKYPFDVQKCDFIFGSWSLSGNMLDVRSKTDKGDLDHYVDNGEWILLDIRADRHVKKYKSCPHPFPDVTFTLLLKRRSLYYIFNLIGPCILITLLHLTSFLLPSESGEKISLNVTLLLGLTVFLLLVAEIMPPQSEVIPVIGQFFAICIVIVSLSTVTSVFVLHLHFRGSRGFPVPRRLRVLVIGKLGRALLYGNLIEKKEEKKPDPGENAALKSLKITRTESYGNGSVKSPHPHSPGHAISTLSCHDDYVLNTEAKQPMEHLGFPHRHVEDKSEAEKMVIRDWILVSLILDRVFFIFFFLADIVLIAYVVAHIYQEATH